jgi:hypothetical protein
VDNSLIINYILILAKYYIYKCSLSVDLQPKLKIFIHRLKVIYKIELRIAKNKDKLTTLSL